MKTALVTSLIALTVSLGFNWYQSNQLAKVEGALTVIKTATEALTKPSVPFDTTPYSENSEQSISECATPVYGCE